MVMDTDCESDDDNDGQNRLAYLFFLQDIDKQVELFRGLLLKTTLVNTKEFWLAHKSQIGLIYKLHTLLYTVPSSSALIERFFIQPTIKG